ncbi:mast cell-expressed membrane protein 1 [Sorex araneus]|uniref:mast cell-expressed membrane protein 1 n=1 Tax=Sorex araneus TaxID=42254 RepID=UPI00033152A8|nr:mast cell-expressed membrane protein 1 [Sorex araneus]
MEPKGNHRNLEGKMQASTFKDKKQGAPASKEAADDPEYENITLTFKHWDQSKGRDKLPKNSGPAQKGQPSAPAPVPVWLYRAVLSLYILLALMFLFCIILSAFILVKNSEMSRELLELKMELSNISNTLRVCQEEWKADQARLLDAIQETQESIGVEYKVVNGYSSKLDGIVKDTGYIKSKVNTISQNVEKLKLPPPSAPSK